MGRFWTLIFERCLCPVGRAIVAYGVLHLPEASCHPDDHRALLQGPPAGHPERLCPESSLSRAESLLWAELFPKRPTRFWR
ncbi:hypothetical protein P3T36_005727 [Kitasatospora sp. MAP12-15]|uniref:DUF6059 family protein n=1 Tax=unclassified Kitasatospora TaxID=2633591 RepID=UPI002473E00D|nr:DUF6059 family protein [Kitasatospora sp. MAP12-44]MDH6113761.1 hypothetical protein [Kitasatospora sp. MAP12-44]